MKSVKMEFNSDEYENIGLYFVFQKHASNQSYINLNISF